MFRPKSAQHFQDNPGNLVDQAAFFCQRDKLTRRNQLSILSLQTEQGFCRGKRLILQAVYGLQVQLEGFFFNGVTDLIQDIEIPFKLCLHVIVEEQKTVAWHLSGTCLLYTSSVRSAINSVLSATGSA